MPIRFRFLPATALALLALLLAAGPCLAEKYNPAVPKPTHSEVKYGEHERHVMDAWLAKGDTPRPLVFVIHGGGWTGGSKELVQRFVDVPALVDVGISVVAINYRLIDQKAKPLDTKNIDLTKNPPVHAPLHDAARALQFVRSKAKEWNINPERIGAAGGSAGACSSLWLAFHDDLADLDSDDPIARQSTRLTCVAVKGAQTTLDPKQMKAWTPNSRYGGHAFGLNNFKDFLAHRDDVLPWIKRYSPYHQVSKDDPPVYLAYFSKPAIGEKQKDPTHTANFGVKLQEQLKAKGVPSLMYYPGIKTATYKSTTDFLIDQLKR
ncbi:MAG: alpha/beta hydrolase [Phycisphaeraceae bacterium]|nr:alpha/beta hydrolase [Phycisphaeraceae bacterium]